MKRHRWVVLVSSALICAAFVIWPELRTKSLQRSFVAIRPGDTRQVVVQRMGSPWKDEGCGKFLGQQTADCVEELVYAHPYAPALPEYWLIQFGADRRVIEKYHTTSP